MTETATKTRSKRTPEQLAAFHQAKANAARAKAGKQQRMVETRRKVIAGASLLGLVEAGDEDAKRVLAKIQAGLTRPQDRQVFGLDEAAKASEQPAPSLEDLTQKIDECARNHDTTTSGEEKQRLAAEWRQAVVAWERAAGKLQPFKEGFDRKQAGLGGIGEILPGF